MKTRYERVKTHVKKYQVVYSCTATAVVFAGFTCLIMRGRCAEVLRVSDEDLVLNRLFVRPLSIFSNGQTTNLVNVVEREGRGHPGYLVLCKETNNVFQSQKKAADFLGIPATVISDHLRGKFDNANGYHLERIAA